MNGGTDGLSFPTSLGTSTADQIRLLGQDLTADLMGQVSFGELAFWLVALRRPSPSEWVAKIEAFRQTLTRAEPDVLVMVGSDHFHQLWLDNMPQFLVGKAPVFDANWHNEEREFGLPRMRLAGEEDLAGYLLREGLDAGFDLAFSNELRIDHSVTCPIITLRPQADLPVVPIYTNIFAPPMPRPERFVQLGRAIRGMVESWPADKRVAIIGTGHLSLELGGPRQFGPHGPDPELTERYRGDPAGTVDWWEREMANTVLNCTAGEKSTWLSFTEQERQALREHDHVTLFQLGAHPFLTLTLFIAMFERDHGPLEYQRAYARAMDHITLPYPDIAT